MKRGSMWGTQSEISFINNLGRFSLRKGIPREVFLRGYLLGYERRNNWDTIDPYVVREFAEKELAKLTGGQ